MKNSSIKTILTTLIVLLIISTALVIFKKNEAFSSFSSNAAPYYGDKIIDSSQFLKDSKIPTQNMEGCYLNKYEVCPDLNGSFVQCTNNFMPLPREDNCDCFNRTFEMCPSPYKISEKKYYNLIKNSDLKKEMPKPVGNFTPKQGALDTRINVWNYNGPYKPFTAQCVSSYCGQNAGPSCENP